MNVAVRGRTLAGGSRGAGRFRLQGMAHVDPGGPTMGTEHCGRGGRGLLDVVREQGLLQLSSPSRSRRACFQPPGALQPDLEARPAWGEGGAAAGEGGAPGARRSVAGRSPGRGCFREAGVHEPERRGAARFRAESSGASTRAPRGGQAARTATSASGTSRRCTRSTTSSAAVRRLNFAKRGQTADLGGRVARCTGARVKIGYQAAIMLLRAGAR